MEEFFERIKPYGKHNIYVKVYELDEHRSVSIKDEATLTEVLCKLWGGCDAEEFEGNG